MVCVTTSHPIHCTQNRTPKIQQTSRMNDLPNTTLTVNEMRTITVTGTTLDTNWTGGVTSAQRGLLRMSVVLHRVIPFRDEVLVVGRPLHHSFTD